MRSNITAFYVANLNNRTVALDTSLMPFCLSLENLDPRFRNYDFFYREFKKTDSIIFRIDDEEYLLQKLTVNQNVGTDDKLTNSK